MLPQIAKFDPNLFQDVIQYTENVIQSSAYTYHLLFDNTPVVAPNFWTIFSDKPRIIGPLKSTSNYRSEILPSAGISIVIFIIWISTGLNYTSVQFSLKPLLNARHDKCLFYTSDSLKVDELMSQLWFKKLGSKIIIDSTRGLLWIDPKVYNNGEMIGVKKMADKIWSNPWMGERLRGRHFRITIFELPPWIYKKSENIQGSPELAGSHLNVMREISQIYNFTFNVTYFTNAGRMLENGTFVGFMATLTYPERGYDFSFVQGLFAILHGKWERASYGCIYGTLRLGFVTNHGSIFIPWYAFTTPLQSDVWLASFILFTFVCIVQFISMYLHHERKVKNVVIDFGTIIPYAMIMEQGLQDIPKGVRYYSFILLVAGTILSTAYKSNLRVNLVFPQKQNIPKTFAELSQRIPEYDVSLGVLGLEYEITRGNKVIQNIGSKLQIIQNPHLDQIVLKMFQEKRSRKSAFIFWQTFLDLNIAKYLSLNEKSLGLAYSKDNIYTLYLTPAFTYQSIYTDSFFGIYNGIFETGVYEKNTEWSSEEYVKSGRSKMKEDKSAQIYKDLIELQNSEELQTTPLTLWNLRVVFGLVPLGGFLALFLFLGENKLIYKLLFILGNSNKRKMIKLYK